MRHLRMLLAAAVVAVVAGLASPALAHARVVATYPRDGQTVSGDVTEVWVRFDEAVALVPKALTLTTDMGIPVNLESPRLTAEHTQLRAFVQDHLAAGRYAVGWRAQADDGHLESATFTFSVAVGSTAGVAPSVGGPPPAASDEPLWPVIVAAAIAVAAGIGAGLAVRRGLRVAGSETPRLPM